MRRLGQAVLVCLLLGIGYLNTRLYYRPHVTYTAAGPVNEDVLHQLRFLKVQMHAGAAEEMQEIYPEGYVYLHALYSLTWIELVKHLAPTNLVYREGRRESAWSLKAIDSSVGRQVFDSELPLPYGAFYQGWHTYILGRYLAMQPVAQRSGPDVARFRRQCAQIAQVLKESPYPESYRGAAWPADGLLCVASLAWHDRILPGRYRPVIRQWLQAAETRLDSLGLIPHQVQPHSGRVLEAARGSSQSQLLNFLLEVDSVYARQHFTRYKAYFLTKRFGLPGIREAANEAAEVADIDSGPVILGIGGAASIVGRRTMQRYGDTTTAVGLRNSIEAFGLPFQRHGQKSYLFGQLPIADAFIAWGNVLESRQEIAGATGWRAGFQLLSGLLAGLLFWGIRWLRPRPVD
ncbi:hypothetical protein HER32_06240 [Hymenobacter sp. BT18]|uniref:hypothetical protein n=1 Tax=Hymenobacter sp. BT18 TaxID=2835648 RepID=UPI00143E2779|nr:hypothetical protein [Hymenobacter sp. BT18]QIX60797.1 hypothetical protein HER32_06240 [Hymenobacter sp. BT18]